MTILYTVLLFAHAISGGLALLSGFIALAVRKGNSTHIFSGRLFLYTMIFSSLSAMVIACLPGHENLFLFLIGIFTLYLLIGGYRALRFKTEKPKFFPDKLLSLIMIGTALFMVVYPLMVQGKINLVLLFMAIGGTVLAIRDFSFFRNLGKRKNDMLRMHIGKITGSYIAAVTAFVVVNQFISALFGWFVPSILGSIVITWHMINVGRQMR